jgi:hypothetical protein
LSREGREDDEVRIAPCAPEQTCGLGGALSFLPSNEECRMNRLQSFRRAKTCPARHSSFTDRPIFKPGFCGLNAFLPCG